MAVPADGLTRSCARLRGRDRAAAAEIRDRADGPRLSANGIERSYGVMVNYVYDLGQIEANHEAYANSAEIATSAQVRKLMKGQKPKKAEEPAPAE